SPSTSTTEFSTAGPPVPSIRRAPTMAVTGPAAPRWASGATELLKNSTAHVNRIWILIVISTPHLSEVDLGRMVARSLNPYGVSDQQIKVTSPGRQPMDHKSRKPSRPSVAGSSKADELR